MGLELPDETNERSELAALCSYHRTPASPEQLRLLAKSLLEIRTHHRFQLRGVDDDALMASALQLEQLANDTE